MLCDYIKLGFILHAGILCFCSLISFHLAHLLFALAFPFKAMNFMNKYSKTAHIVEVIVVLVLGSSTWYNCSQYLQISHW